MDIKQIKIDDLNALLRVKVSPVDYKDKVDETLKSYRKQANIPGFRQGKVPMGLIKKKYGPPAIMSLTAGLAADQPMFSEEDLYTAPPAALPAPAPANTGAGHAPERFLDAASLGARPRGRRSRRHRLVDEPRAGR